MKCSVYDEDHMSPLGIKNTSDRDLRSCEETLKAVRNKTQKGILTLQLALSIPLEPQNFFWALLVTA